MGMREMKDSGIEWIGEIPKDWDILRLKYCFSGFANGTSDTQLNSGESIYPVTRIETISSGEINLDKIGYVAFCKKQYLLKTGDILVSNINSIKYLGNCAVVRDGYKLYHGMNLLRIVPSDYIDKGYAYYLFKSNVLKFPMEKYCKPAINQASVSATTMKNFFIPFPAFVKQQQIANFLDSKCSEIDATAEDIQKEITLLEEYKKSVITEAVTKGLNPDAEMKDSGIAWIGEIPINWQAVNPRWLFAQRKDRAKKGMEQYTASQKYGVISQKDYMNRIGGSIVTVQKDFDILKMVCEGDFVIHMRSFQGGLEYSEHTGSISSAYVMLIPQKNTGECRYFKWLFKSASYINALQSTSNLIRDGQAMRYSNFIQIIIPYPPLDEQQQIADYLDSKCSEIDAIIADKKRQRGILTEYKKSLIYEYVTGKKEVPVHE